MDTISIGKHNPLSCGHSQGDPTWRADQRRTASDRRSEARSAKLMLVASRLSALLVREGVTLRRSCLARRPRYTLEPSVFKGIQRYGTLSGRDRPRSTANNGLSTRRPRQVCTLRWPCWWVCRIPGNVGTILRVAESFGAGGCLGLSGTVSVHNSKVVRASAGSVFRLPHVWDLALEVVVEQLKAQKDSARRNVASCHGLHHVLGLEPTRCGPDRKRRRGTEPRTDLPLVLPCCSIPHAPPTESLNSAIAAAVILLRSLPAENASMSGSLFEDDKPVRPTARSAHWQSGCGHKRWMRFSDRSICSVPASRCARRSNAIRFLR